MHTSRRTTPALALLVFVVACGRGEDPSRSEGSTGGETTSATTDTDARMTVDAMDRVLRAVTPKIERQKNAWALEYLDTPVLIVTDPVANRMRIVSPVIDAGDVTEEQWAAILVANFHTALDARYAVSGGTVYSLYLHPLGSLTEADLRSAISQVVTLAKTFGSSYNSTGVVFGGTPPADPTPSSGPPSL